MNLLKPKYVLTALSFAFLASAGGAQASTSSEISIFAQKNNLSLSAACIYTGMGALEMTNYATRVFGYDQLVNFDHNYKDIMKSFHNIAKIAATQPSEQIAKKEINDQLTYLNNRVDENPFPDFCISELKEKLAQVAKYNTVTSKHGISRAALIKAAVAGANEAKQIKSLINE